MAPRVLLYRAGALGDTLLALPALDALRAAFPGASLTLAANPAYAAPLLDAGRIDALLDAGGSPFHLLYAAPGGEDEMSRLLASFEAAVFFTSDVEGGAARRLAASGGSRSVLAAPFPPPGEKTHIAEWMLRCVAPLGAGAVPLPPEPLRPSAESRAAAGELLGRLGLEGAPGLAIHPGSGGREKCAPPFLMADIVRLFCAGGGARPFLIRGPADAGACDDFEREWGEVLPAAETGRTEVLAALLAGASAYLGCDSGVTHLAALCGTPALALVGHASEPALWRPIGARADCASWENAEAAAARLAGLATP